MLGDFVNITLKSVRKGCKIDFKPAKYAAYMILRVLEETARNGATMKFLHEFRFEALNHKILYT